jgi:hypothetical protein
VKATVEERQSNGFHLQWAGETVACPHTFSLRNATLLVRDGVDGTAWGFQ